MKTKRTPVACAAALALFATLARAEGAAAPGPAASAVAPDAQHVLVTGIRAAVQQSLERKREAETHVDVVTAEDIGKMPDKNVADSLQRLPGVTISSAGGNEGGFDENDRVSMRGTNPSLTQTLINGHGVASGDWFLLNQTETVGRSVSYTLLPSELVGSVVVHKTAQAELVEGGVAGSVDILTRKPLDFDKPTTFNLSAGLVYADLPKAGDGQLSGLFDWRSEGRTFGVIVQGFSESRSLRRDGQEILGYEQIAPDSPVAAFNPDLSGVFYPSSISSTLFEQTRRRTGGLVEVEYKPLDTLSLDVSAFHSKLQAANVNYSFSQWDARFIDKGQGQSPSPGYVVRDNTLVQAYFKNPSPNQPLELARVYGVYDQISRPDEYAETGFVAFEGKLELGRFSLMPRLGSTSATGATPTEDVAQWDLRNSDASYKLNGLHAGADWSLPGASTSAPDANVGLDWIFGDEGVKVRDRETWRQLDARYALDLGVLADLKAGVRATHHARDSLHVIDQIPTSAAYDPANKPPTSGNYPPGFGKGLGGDFPRDVWTFSPAQLAAFDAAFAQRDPVAENYPTHEFSLDEKTQAGYLQADFDGAGWSGDLGVRIVGTKEDIETFQLADAATPGAITGSNYGVFVPVHTRHDYTDALPSANLRYELRHDLVARFAASRTMTRPDYSALAGTVALTPPDTPGGTGTGTGGNPDLKPVTSNNLDAALEWYFAPRGLLAASVYSMDLTSYVSFGEVRRSYTTFDHDHPGGVTSDYVLSVPVNSSGTARGVELDWQQALLGAFGASANATWTHTRAADGTALVGASKSTFNLGAFYENDIVNARVAYSHRSSFFSGLDRSTAFYQAGTGVLSASLGLRLNEALSLQLDGRNLNNPTLRYYAANEEQPRAFYRNGRQYFLTLRWTL